MSKSTEIIQCFIPSLVSGVYTVDVQQVITKNKENLQKAPFFKSLKFGVDAARFTLNDADIYSVYPPANHYGNYKGALPHIVFTRRTLPWERTIDGKPPLFMQEGQAKNPVLQPPVPWMALIMLNENEIKELKIKKNTLNNVILPDDAAVTHPAIHSNGEAVATDLKLMAWEKTSDGCFTIDITKNQFDRYIPALDSLPYLAHSKIVSIAHKDKTGITDVNEAGAGVFSVVVSSAFIPEEDGQFTAVLVSLEGFSDYLIPSAGQPPKKAIPANSSVRMVVLANWKFHNSGTASFFELAKGLRTKALKITKGMGNAEYAAELGSYFEPGYVPMEHLTRKGVKNISWYHGPFTPKLLPKSTQSISFPNADAALRYDQNNGFFDISIAAAWQLGRMLALQNLGFSKAMLNWRIKQKQNELIYSQASAFNVLLNDTSTRTIKDKVIRYLGGTPVNICTESPAESGLPADITTFLSQLYRLNGVPFSYLVPHELLLEDETLAFFYVDPNWIEALLDGALSIARTQGNDRIRNAVMNGGIVDFTSQLSANKDVPGTCGSVAEHLQLNVTGFLLRSALISGWRGIEIEAFDSTDTLLPALRFERIDNNIFLGIFNGNVTKIVITQPYEGLHFGFEPENGTYSKSLKNEKDGNSDGSVNVNAQLPELLSKHSVIDVAGLATIMKQQLLKNNGLDGQSFTSAEFAFQMVNSPVKYEIDISLQVQSDYVRAVNFNTNE